MHLNWDKTFHLSRTPDCWRYWSAGYTHTSRPYLWRTWSRWYSASIHRCQNLRIKGTVCDDWLWWDVFGFGRWRLPEIYISYACSRAYFGSSKAIPWGKWVPKRHFPSEFALFLTSLLLYHFVRFVKCVGKFYWSYFKRTVPKFRKKENVVLRSRRP